jgi:hypothetical protein
MGRPRRPLFASAFVLAAISFGAAGSARAQQTLPSIDARTWRPSTDPNAGLVLEPIGTPGPWQCSAGAWLSYAENPIALRSASTGDVVYRPVTSLLGLDLTAGIGIGERAAIGLAVPTILYQDGTAPLPSTVVSSGSATQSGVGDISLYGKATIIANQKGELRSGFGLGAIAGLTLPTGDREGFMGDGSTTAQLRVLAEYAMYVASVQASVGYKVRTEQRTWPTSNVVPLTFGDEIPWSLGIAIKPGILSPSLDADNRQTWELAAHGWLPATPIAPFGLGDPGGSQLSPVMVAASDRIALGHYRDAYVVAGVDIGLNNAVGVPAVRGIIAIGWAPREHDADHDGIPDDLDQCPELAEDHDGIQDEDGCPEDDADGDGILDAQDACPLVPGVWWNDPKKNGCPAPDTDGDGIPDPLDACPTVKGVPSDDPKKNGCPAVLPDRDKDGVPDDVDKCPDQPENLRGANTSDGCPDSDGDGIHDGVDACPKEKGVPSADPTRNGCPNLDRDGDTFDDDVDPCPDQAEVFNGIKDDDGCPDEGGKPLVTVDASKPHPLFTLAAPIVIAGTADAPEVDKKSVMTVRAVAQELNRHPDWTLAVGARPGPGKPDGKSTAPPQLGQDQELAQKVSLGRALALVKMIAAFTHRGAAAEVVGWDAVKQQPGAASGIGLLVLVSLPSEPPPVSTPAPAPAPSGKKP